MGIALDWYPGLENCHISASCTVDCSRHCSKGALQKGVVGQRITDRNEQGGKHTVRSKLLPILI